MISVHRTKKLFPMGFEIQGLVHVLVGNGYVFCYSPLFYQCLQYRILWFWKSLSSVASHKELDTCIPVRNRQEQQHKERSIEELLYRSRLLILMNTIRFMTCSEVMTSSKLFSFFCFSEKIVKRAKNCCSQDGYHVVTYELHVLQSLFYK